MAAASGANAHLVDDALVCVTERAQAHPELARVGAQRGVIAFHRALGTVVDSAILVLVTRLGREGAAGLHKEPRLRLTNAAVGVERGERPVAVGLTVADLFDSERCASGMNTPSGVALHCAVASSEWTGSSAGSDRRIRLEPIWMRSPSFRATFWTRCALTKMPFVDPRSSR